MGEYKAYKTIEEQIELLRSRGLKIDNEEQAKQFLLTNNYYRISGYSLTLRKDDVFSPNASFQNIMDIYNFDYELRHILLKYLEIIEVTFKSIYTYEFTKKHGGLGYLNVSLFSDSVKHNEIIQKIKEQKNYRYAHEAFLKHYIDDLHEEIPLWAIVELMTISNIYYLYNITEQDIKNDVAAQYQINTSNRANILSNAMKCMCILRNLCAHDSRLYNRLFEQKPSLNKGDKSLLPKAKDGNIDNAHLYGYILIMRRLLKKNQFLELKVSIMSLTLKYPFVSMDYYGFRSDWLKKL